MTFQEFPKALYRGDEYVSVPDAQAEAEHRAQGWGDYGQEPTEQAGEENKSRRARSPKPLTEQAGEG